jgi:molecular chaperone GrpE
MQGSENGSAFGTDQPGKGQEHEQAAEQTGGQGGWPEATTSADEQLAKLQEEATQFKDLYLRAKADGENLRRRAQEDIAKAHKFGIEAFAESLLPVKDSLEAALAVQGATLEAFREGMDITLKQLATAFEKNKLMEIAPAAGARFDPHQHQAISMVPSDQEANTVVATLQKGYTIADRVLRPALVTVSQGKGA